MGSEAGDFSRLTLRHGCKCMPDAAGVSEGLSDSRECGGRWR